MKLNRQNTEIFSQQHQMYAEGAEDEQMTEKDVFDFLYTLGWESTGTIEIFHDDMQGLWRWIANKIAYPKPATEMKKKHNRNPLANYKPNKIAHPKPKEEGRRCESFADHIHRITGNSRIAPPHPSEPQEQQSELTLSQIINDYVDQKPKEHDGVIWERSYPVSAVTEIAIRYAKEYARKCVEADRKDAADNLRIIYNYDVDTGEESSTINTELILNRPITLL